MSRWTTLTSDDLKAAGHSAIVDRGRTLAAGTVDPVEDSIAGAVARVRRAVSAANALDLDPAKVPLSLKTVAVRLALYALMERIGLALSVDQREARQADQNDLDRLADRRILVEAPDVPDASAAPGNRGSWNSERKIVGRTHPVPAPGRQYPPTEGGYANPEAPQDSVE